MSFISEQYLEKNDIINNWKQYINNNLIQLIGNKPEGNIYTSHQSTIPNDFMIQKQINIVTFMTKFKPKNILEIGFNAGFSALLMKMSYSQNKFTCIDINHHKYVIPCFQLIKNDFNFDMNIILESSHTALEKLIKEDNNYDFIHIDGDHSLNGATKDLELCIKLSKSGTIIMFDDTNISYLNDLCNKYIHNGYLKEYIFDKIEGTKYNHRFLEVV
jgi:predicted O-methyltransferase YrrM